MTRNNISTELDNLFFQIDGCTKCNLRKKCAPLTGISGSNGFKTPNIFIILTNPTKEAAEQGDVLEGVVGDYLKKMISKSGIGENNIFVGHLVNCPTPGNKEPDEEIIKICSDWLQKQINLAEPKVLIACGKQATRFLLNLPKKTLKLEDYVGKEYPYGNFHTQVIPAYSISYCLRHGWPTEQKMLSIFKKAREIAI